MKKALTVFMALAVCAVATAADFFFYHGKDTDVPSGVRYVRVIDHRGEAAAGAKVVVSLVTKEEIERTTDTTGIAQFPKLDVSRVVSVRCELSSLDGVPYIMSISADPKAIAWPVIFHLRPRP